MTRTTHHFALLSALALALAPGAAQARFGKSDRSDDSKQESNSNTSNHSGGGGGDDTSTSTSSGGGHYHAASPVGSDRPVVVRPGGGCASDGCCWRGGSAWPAYYGEPTYVYPGYRGAEEVRTSNDQGLRIRTEVTGDVMPFSTLDGGSIVGQLRVEGVKWGVALEGRHIGVAADDGSGTTDTLAFLNGFISYSLLGGERGRLRLEAGANTAFAPELIVMSPAVGVSVALGFGDNFGLEALARASLLPHVQLELGAGLSYALGPLGLRLGVRRIYLNDNGLVDGVAHDDAFTGPYFGAGFAF